MNFILISNQNYDFELKTNKWHIANQMASKGHKVIFVDPPLRNKALGSNLFEQINENLVVYRPKNTFNFRPFTFLNNLVHKAVIESQLRKFDNDEKTILYIYHFDFPDLRHFMSIIKHDISVYDCVDIYAEFPEYAEGKKIQSNSIVANIQKLDEFFKVHINQGGLKLKDWVNAQEKWLCNSVDLVFGSAPGVINHLQKWKEDEVHYLPNAVEYDKFDKVEELAEPEDLQNIQHPRIGFTGAIDTYKNNIELIEKCAQTYPNYNFIMIGPEKVSDPDLDLSRLKKMDNVHFLGKKPWHETPAYFKYFDAYFIPYNVNEYTLGCHPIKYFEGLASGLPTIITLPNSVKQFDVDGYATENDQEFIDNIKTAIDNNNEDRRKRRKAMAKQNTWSMKADKIISLIKNTVESKN